jgi:hypothetical protein
MITDANDESLSFDSIEEFDEYMPFNNASVTQFVKTASQNASIKTTAFVLLDLATMADNTTCYIAIDCRHDEYMGAGWLGFRCEFPSIVPALEALGKGQSVRELRNQAAMAGGTWRKNIVAEQLARASPINPSDFPCHKDWKPVYDYSRSFNQAVFRNVEISREVSQTHQHWPAIY